MLRFTALRLMHLAIVLFGTMTLLFLLLRVSGDPAAGIAGPDAGPELIDEVRAQLGLDQPLFTQYLHYLANLITFDFGTSYQTRQDTIDLVGGQLGATLQLVGISFAVAVVVAVPLGALAGVVRNRVYHRFLDGLVLLGQAVPIFWFAILLVYLFSVQNQWLPSIHTEDPSSWVLPVVALAVHPMARLLQFTRSGLTESLGEDYTRTAVSKGLGPLQVVTGHALRPVSTSLVTVAGLDLAQMLSGSVLIESIFAWPGIGNLMVTSVSARDYPVVEAMTFVFAVLVVVINLVVDLAYEWIDPRVRAQ